MTWVLFIGGFILLIKGVEWLVDGATSIAFRFGISDLIIGLTIVSLGTSMPELLVNVLASINGNPGLATGNILGSNIANVLLILGASAAVSNLKIQRNTVLSEVPFSITAALLVGFLANSILWYETGDELHISRGNGIIILFFFFLFMTYVLLMAKDKQVNNNISMGGYKRSISKNILWVLAGIVGLFIGGKWVVDSSINIAKMFGMSDSFIGLTVVAIGTSLPELVTSVTAALKKNADIAIGNVVGSNIFNLLWVMAISAIIHPMPFNVVSNVDLVVVIGSSTMILLVLIIGRRWEIGRFEGVFFLLAYLGYLYFLIERG